MDLNPGHSLRGRESKVACLALKVDTTFRATNFGGEDRLAAVGAAYLIWVFVSLPAVFVEAQQVFRHDVRAGVKNQRSRGASSKGDRRSCKQD
jgi:hypothetical protein